jgi:hypothetical protein
LVPLLVSAVVCDAGSARADAFQTGGLVGGSLVGGSRRPIRVLGGCVLLSSRLLVRAVGTRPPRFLIALWVSLAREPPG